MSDDGLVTPTVGDWAEEKYRLIRCYADIFSTSMKKKWDRRIYVDLFAGPGQARIRGTSKIVASAPLLVTSVKFPFDRYVFCELDRKKLDALKDRVDKASPNVDARYVHGDSNASTSEIASLIKPGHGAEKVLTFCLVDPYRLGDLQFTSLRALAIDRSIDFLVLIPSGMDATRNRNLYLRARSARLDEFLGRSDWRSDWGQAERSGRRFAEFVVDQFGKSMQSLSFKYSGLDSAHLVTSTSRRLPIYHLVMFSRHDLGGDFWEKCKANSKPQRRLF